MLMNSKKEKKMKAKLIEYDTWLWATLKEAHDQAIEEYGTYEDDDLTMYNIINTGTLIHNLNERLEKAEARIKIIEDASWMGG